MVLHNKVACCAAGGAAIFIAAPPAQIDNYVKFFKGKNGVKISN
jgi:hypothetical protein